MRMCRARIPLRLWVAVLAALAFGGTGASAQDKQEPFTDAETVSLRMNVNEVVVTFNAIDANGLPLHDLKAEEFRIRDNGFAPKRIVAFDELLNRPIRAGMLLDTSESMREALPGSREIAEKFVNRVFREGSDRAFVARFGNGLTLLQSWTGDRGLILRGLRMATEQQANGTALFNAVFQMCSSTFNKVDPTATGNFILLFSDGEDNAGLTSLDDAARACQRTNTEVFAFIPASAQERASTGPKAIREFAEKTGGLVFLSDDSDVAIGNDLSQIELQMRNQYRLVYNPAALKHNGGFHEIELQPPDRVDRVFVRSGYFAPLR
jgi:Ca-activated chloride channel homolog